VNNEERKKSNADASVTYNDNKVTENINVHELSDPQMIAKLYPDSLPTEINDTTRKLKSKSKFVEGNCGTISSSIKPRLIYLPNDFTIDLPECCKILTSVLHELILKEFRKTTFICNNVKEIVFIRYAFETLGQPLPLLYAPYLLGHLPDSEEKRSILDGWRNVGSHLITDYRSIRGWESSSCVSFVDPNEKYANHVLIEVITRATSKLDLFVIASSKSKDESTSCLSKILDGWSDCKEEIKVVEEIKVQIEPLNEEIILRFKLSFGSHSGTVKVTKKDKSTFMEIKKSIQKKRKDNFDNGKAYE